MCVCVCMSVYINVCMCMYSLAKMSHSLSFYIDTATIRLWSTTPSSACSLPPPPPAPLILDQTFIGGGRSVLARPILKGTVPFGAANVPFGAGSKPKCALKIGVLAPT